MFLLIFFKFHSNLYLCVPNRDCAKISRYFDFVNSATLSGLLEAEGNEFSHYLLSEQNWELRGMSKIDKTKIIIIILMIITIIIW